MELKVTDDKVREAAKSCPDAARVLKMLFPEAFKDDRYIMRDIEGIITFFDRHGNKFQILPRASGEFAGRALLLPLTSHPYEWAIINDGSPLLTLRRKEA
jgi:hypothetical protein